MGGSPVSGKDGYNYSQITRAIREDPQFASVWAEDRHLGAWLRLFMEADEAWPDQATLSRLAGQDSIDLLVEKGVVELSPGGDQYRMPEADNGRMERSAAGSKAGKASQIGARREPGTGRYARRTPTPVGTPLGETPTPVGQVPTPVGAVGPTSPTSSTATATTAAPSSSKAENTPAAAAEPVKKDDGRSAAPPHSFAAEFDAILSGSPPSSTPTVTAAAPLAFADEVEP
jgi:hypothetical protein